MLGFAGLDLCAPAWRCCEAGVQPSDVKFLPRHAETIAVDLPELFTVLNRTLKASSELPELRNRNWDTDTIIRRSLQSYADELHGFVRAQSGAEKICVTFPYTVSRAIRRALPLFVNEDALATQKRRYLAIEAPLAVCLELVATQHIELPADVLVLTAAESGVELTSIHLTARQTELHMSVESCREIRLSAADPPIAEQLRRGPPSPVAGERDSGPHVYVVGTEGKDVAREVCRVRGIPESRLTVLDPHSASLGAARYAAFISQRVLHGTVYDKIDMPRVSARAIGVLGTNRSGAMFWRKLFAAGGRYESSHARVAVSHEQLRQPSLTLVLAECTNADCEPPSWLAQSDWPRYDLQFLMSKTIGRPRSESSREQQFIEFGLKPPVGQLLVMDFTAKFT
jgi:hypothetical protein